MRSGVPPSPRDPGRHGLGSARLGVWKGTFLTSVKRDRDVPRRVSACPAARCQRLEFVLRAVRSTSRPESLVLPLNANLIISLELNDGIPHLFGQHLSRLVAGCSSQLRRMARLAVTGQTNIRALVDVS